MHILPSGLPPSLVFRNGRLFDHDVPSPEIRLIFREDVKRYRVCKRKTPREAPGRISTVRKHLIRRGARSMKHLQINVI